MRRDLQGESKGRARAGGKAGGRSSLLGPGPRQPGVAAAHEAPHGDEGPLWGSDSPGEVPTAKPALRV